MAKIKGKSYNWVIMSALQWIKGKPSIDKIITENNHNGTIMVIKRDGVRTFVLGSQGEYAKVGETVSYIKDTGNGYSGSGYCEVENVVTINASEIVDPGNGIGVNEKRPLYVFK